MKKYLKFFLLFPIVFFCVHIRAQIITTIAGKGTGGNGGDGSPATAASLWALTSVAVDANGNLYISNYNSAPTVFSSSVRKVNAAGIISTFAGNDTMGFSGDGGPATAAKLNIPGCITFDKKGNVYIDDLNGNKRVRKVDTNGIITTFAGNGSAIPSGDGGLATAAGLGIGEGICMDTAGNLYIAAGNKIRKVDTAGIITTFAGTGSGIYSGDGGPATAAGISALGQIAIDRYGNMYITDANHLIRKINTAGIITTVAGNGTPGYSGDGGPATAAQLNSNGPTGVFPDNCDNLYIVDNWSNRVRIVNGSGYITTFAGNGTMGFSGDGGLAKAAELSEPAGVYIDKNGSIYIADTHNLRVRYVHMDSCRNTTASPGLSKGEEVLRVWPNPNYGSFTVNISSAINEPAQIIITNIVGIVVKEFSTVTNKETELNLHVPGGMYFVSVVSVQGRWCEKVVVR